MSQRPANANPPETPTEAAARWFALRRRQPDTIEEQQFTDWVRADTANRWAYEEITRSWEISGLASADPTIVAMRTEALLARPRRTRDYSRLWGALATATVVMGAFVGVSVMRPDLIASAGTSSTHRDQIVLRTGIGERATATLDDGSVVTLNTNSVLQINYSRFRRDVRLVAGQVLFKVAHDTARPFIVAAANREVVAVGTEFEVRLEGEKVRVALLQGRVRVRPIHSRGTGSSEGTMLAPGEQLVASSAGLFVRRADVQQIVSWESGRVRFDDIRLADAVAEMNRYSHTPIVIADPRIRDTRISGSFRAGQSWSFAEAVGEAFPIKAESNGDMITLQRETGKNPRSG